MRILANGNTQVCQLISDVSYLFVEKAPNPAGAVGFPNVETMGEYSFTEKWSEMTNIRQINF